MPPFSSTTSTDKEVPKGATMQNSAYLNEEQYTALIQPLDSAAVQKNESGQSYLPQWDIRARLNRHFGFGRYDIEILDKNLVVDSRGAEFVYVVYEVTVRLTIRDQHGRKLAQWDDVAAADATGYKNGTPKQLTLGQAYHTAQASAVAAALRRCAVNLGDQYGLSLYNDGSLNPVVGYTLFDPLPTEEDVPATPYTPDPDQEEDEAHAPS